MALRALERAINDAQACNGREKSTRERQHLHGAVPTRVPIASAMRRRHSVEAQCNTVTRRILTARKDPRKLPLEGERGMRTVDEPDAEGLDEDKERSDGP